MFWFPVQLLSETFLILKLQQVIINVHKSSHKVPVILVRFSSNSNFQTFLENTQIPWNSVQWEPGAKQMDRYDKAV